MPYALSAVEARVLGCLIEKGMTTPDVYPLSLNSLMLACNQKSNRDPVMELEEQTVLRTVDKLRDINLAQMINMAGSRVMKYSHDAERSLGLDKPALALLCELLVRGPQTPGELRGRASRMTPFDNIESVETLMNSLMARQPEPLVVLLPRQPGRKESRYAHLLSGEVRIEEITAAPAPGPAPEKARLVIQAENERMDKLEGEMSAMRKELTVLQEQIAEIRKLVE